MRTLSFKPCWCGEWFGGTGAQLIPGPAMEVSNLVGVESGSEVRACDALRSARPSFKPCWCGEWFGGVPALRRGDRGTAVSNLVGVESGSEDPVRAFDSEGFQVSNLVGVESGSEVRVGGFLFERLFKFQTLLVWRVVRRVLLEVESPIAQPLFQTLLVWRVVRRSCIWFGVAKYEDGFQTLLVWRVVRRLGIMVMSPRPYKSFQTLLVWRVVRRFRLPRLGAAARRRVSNLVGVESGSEDSTNSLRLPRRSSFKPCWCGEWFGGTRFFRAVAACKSGFKPCWCGEWFGGSRLASSSHSIGQCFKPCWCGEWFGGSHRDEFIRQEKRFQTLLVWRVVRRLDQSYGEFIL